MKKEEIYQVFVKLGELLSLFGEDKHWSDYSCGLTKEEFESFNSAIRKENQHNPWFTQDNVRNSLKGISDYLQQSSLDQFARKYSYASAPKSVAIIMAGNIPFVGFHDFMCVLLSGNKAVCKLSSSDNRLPLHLFHWLSEWNPAIKERIEICLGPLKKYEAVIATGSNNSIQHFATYFGNVPHIFRKNRTSIAVLDGSETEEELISLGHDCFAYFGMGCRNVSKVFIPKGFDTDRIFKGLVEQQGLINHHKYGNNYDYNRTVYLMNSIPFLDNNCVMLKEDNGLHAPLSVIFYSHYSTIEEVEAYIKDHSEELQAIVGHGFIPFGQAQKPGITDFADNLDTMLWLNQL